METGLPRPDWNLPEKRTAYPRRARRGSAARNASEHLAREPFPPARVFHYYAARARARCQRPENRAFLLDSGVFCVCVCGMPTMELHDDRPTPSGIHRGNGVMTSRPVSGRLVVLGEKPKNTFSSRRPVCVQRAHFHTKSAYKTAGRDDQRFEDSHAPGGRVSRFSVH